MTHSKWRGHDIECIDDVWIYSDNKKPVSEDKNRSCGHCGKSQTKEGHDGCLGTINGVMNACCGHGNSDEAYIQYKNGSELRGEKAMNIIKENQEKCEAPLNIMDYLFEGFPILKKEYDSFEILASKGIPSDNRIYELYCFVNNVKRDLLNQR